MHEMKLRVQVLRPRSRAVCVDPCHWSDGRHNYVAVSLQERRAAMQVMLGVSLQARWDATLVATIMGNRIGVHNEKNDNKYVQ